jgi:hypothetical protein
MSLGEMIVPFMGKVIPLVSLQERSCFECEYALFGVSGTFCKLYRIDVIDEKQEAQECEDYAPC